MDAHSAVTLDDDNMEQYSSTAIVSSKKPANRKHPIWKLEIFLITGSNVICRVKNCKQTFTLPSSTTVCVRHRKIKKDQFHKDAYAAIERIF